MNDEDREELPPNLKGARGFTEMLAALNGQNIEKHRERAAFRAALEEKAKQYLGKPVTDWPVMTFSWDLDPASARRSLDGFSADEFNKHYPHGVQYGWVNLADLDAVLCRMSRVPVAEQWTVRSADKLARAIVYIADGNPVSPPLIAPVKINEGWQIHLVGGNHRYAVALAKQEQRIPVCFDPSHGPALQRLVLIHERQS